MPTGTPEPHQNGQALTQCGGEYDSIWHDSKNTHRLTLRAQSSDAPRYQPAGQRLGEMQGWRTAFSGRAFCPAKFFFYSERGGLHRQRNEHSFGIKLRRGGSSVTPQSETSGRIDSYVVRACETLPNTARKEGSQAQPASESLGGR